MTHPYPYLLFAHLKYGLMVFIKCHTVQIMLKHVLFVTFD